MRTMRTMRTMPTLRTFRSLELFRRREQLAMQRKAKLAT
jgi:hypothetical protein